MTDLFVYEKRKKRIGERIKALRQEMKMTQKQLAGHIDDIVPTDKDKGFGQSTISGWERGDQLPPLPKLIALSEIFQCDISFLLCDYDKKKKDVMDVSEITGLSETAVLRLSGMQSRIQRERNAGWVGTLDEKELKAINTFLECDYSILVNIHEYLFGQYDSFSLLYGERDDQEVFNREVRLCNNNSPGGGLYIRANQMQSVFLLEIQNGLMELQNLIKGTPKKSNAKKTPKKCEPKGVSKNG